MEELLYNNLYENLYKKYSTTEKNKKRYYRDIKNIPLFGNINYINTRIKSYY